MFLLCTKLHEPLAIEISSKDACVKQTLAHTVHELQYDSYLITENQVIYPQLLCIAKIYG